MKKTKIIFSIILSIIILSTALFLIFRPPTQEVPKLSSSIIEKTIKHNGLDRTYSFYKPKGLQPLSPLVIVFHRAKSSGIQMRELTGYRFDKIADDDNFIVVYPDGYEGNWNDCRKSAKDSAHKLNIDDVGFIKSLIDLFVKEYSIDRSRVFLTGLSNGGHMCFKLAMEISDKIRAIAAIAAHIPVKENNSCSIPHVPVSILLVSGTNDPINPFEGGDVSILGIIKKGQVLSAMGTVEFWLKAFGISASPTFLKFPDKKPDDGSWIDRKTWSSKGNNQIALYTVHGGGHTIPGTKQHLSFFWGKTNQDIIMVDEIMKFFSALKN